MSSYRRQCRMFQQLCLGMLAVGLSLPIFLSLAFPSVLVSPAIWNFLQIGGLTGGIVFWFLGKFGKKADEPQAAEPTPA